MVFTTAEEDAKPKKGVAKPKPSTLTGYDRYWLRFVAVTLVVVGPMVGIARFGVVRAVAHHGLWFIPTTPPDLRSIGAGTPRDFKDHAQLLRHVPNEAEVAGNKDPGQPCGRSGPPCCDGRSSCPAAFARRRRG